MDRSSNKRSYEEYEDDNEVEIKVEKKVKRVPTMNQKLGYEKRKLTMKRTRAVGECGKDGNNCKYIHDYLHCTQCKIEKFLCCLLGCPCNGQGYLISIEGCPNIFAHQKENEKKSTRISLKRLPRAFTRLRTIYQQNGETENKTKGEVEKEKEIEQPIPLSLDNESIFETADDDQNMWVCLNDILEESFSPSTPN